MAMTKVNGHADGASASLVAPQPAAPAAGVVSPHRPQLTIDEIKAFTADLEVPFHASVIEWRVINTSSKNSGKGEPLRGQVLPFADQRAYTDRLNDMFTPAGWTREYQVHTSGTFQRSKDQRTAAKVFVTCQVTIYGLGSHSATGEEWADDENAGTSAEAQAFKRACSCFGLGRYLYYFSGVWVDLDARKRPKKTPQLFGWATPDGWQQGLRPPQQSVQHPSAESDPPKHAKSDGGHTGSGNAAVLIREIEALATPLGKSLYRGLLKTVGKAWKPADIRDSAVLQTVLEHMQGAQRGLGRLTTAVKSLGPDQVQAVLRELKLASLDKVDNLETLKRVVVALEQAAGKDRA